MQGEKWLLEMSVVHYASETLRCLLVSGIEFLDGFLARLDECVLTSLADERVVGS